MELALAIPESAWHVAAGDRSWLRTTLTVNGLSMHLDAIEVELANGSIQRGRGDSEADLSLIHQAVAAESHWQTLEIGGREYVLIATPFC